MKSLHKTAVRLLLSTAFFSTVALANPLQGTQPLVLENGGEKTGNGGAGLEKNGRPMTFYTAGLYTEPKPRTQTAVPSLEWTMRFIQWMPFLSQDSKVQLTSAMIPSPRHEYYVVDGGHFDEKTKARLLAEFERVTQVDPSQLRLFAVTDTGRKQTFLLPGFFSLSPQEQGAILFHETYWVLHPNSTYNQVVAAEMAFQAVLESPTDSVRILDFMTYYSTPSDRLMYAVNTDRNSGALKGLLQQDNRILLTQLLGEDYVACESSEVHNACFSKYLNPHLAELIRKYPNSLFLQLLQSRISSEANWFAGVSMLVRPLNGQGICPKDYILFIPVTPPSGQATVYLPARTTLRLGDWQSSVTGYVRDNFNRTCASSEFFSDLVYFE